ncbi:MAG: DUF4365 domain-containing protein [Anaeromicrobium sp.]|jgi:hypothetical protein|uniref:DUF4365 domain-containing protein n=1 Tax=Anaeromicrobium sp. TaxID=1929132 RepID=UPI0025CB8D95|nr:DUF4365 domain-containing protein [Anaeromicrobium sp.]MCT4593578.1 DUF4365 domain-containing protein [Anaeromicrobium sp.]
MDNNAIEILAVNAVKSSITISDYLTPFIADNDKEPTWDGNVYIYNDKSKKKRELKGRVAVQVKGKESNDFSRDKISFPVEVADLKNYLYDGGVIFFVVYIGNNGLINKIYYADLLPIKLRVILAEAKSQQTKTIELKEFPTDNNHKATIFLNFYEHSSKQASFKSAELLSLDDLQEQGVLKGISLTVSGYGYDRNDPQKALFENDVYIYANIKGCSIPQPIEMLPYDLNTTQEIQNQVFANGKLFYNSYFRVRSKGKDTFKFGKSLTLEISEEHRSCKISYKTTDTLRTIINDLGFMLNVLEAKCFVVENTTFPIAPTYDELVNFDIEQQKKNLEYYEKMQQVLDILNVKEDLILAKMTAKEKRNFDDLIKAFVEKEPVSGLNPDLPNVMKLQISNITLMLSFFPCEEAGTYQILDFFRTNYNVKYEDGNGNMQPISQYAILKKEDYLKVSNMRFDVLLPSYQCIKDNQHISERANFVLLNLLYAYDESGRKEILNTAKAFAEWLISTDDTMLTYEIKKLNLLQIIKRERKFNIEEIKALFAITENSATREEMLVGAYLLLDNQVAAELHFDCLDPMEQENFKEYPIYKFWKSKAE